MVIGISAGLLTAHLLARAYHLKKDLILDLSFWLIIGSLIGARIYEVFLEFPYYSQNPGAIIKIWQGGLAIHGAILAGLIITAIFARQKKISFWLLTALIVPGLALGQAIGRWGNYFNQELFGLPTNLPWGIPIDIINRPLQYIGQRFFHPTFLYESLGDFLIFLVLLLIHVIIINKRQGGLLSLSRRQAVRLTTAYLFLYSLLRFNLEFIKIDPTPTFFNWRWPQIISLIIAAIALVLFIFSHAPNKSATTGQEGQP